MIEQEMIDIAKGKLFDSEEPLELIYTRYDQRRMSSIYKCPICSVSYPDIDASNEKFRCKKCGRYVIFPPEE